MVGNRTEPGKIKVLFVAADPTIDPTKGLMLDEEIREITQKIRLSEHRDVLDITYTLAARSDDLLQSLNQHRPHIVHFSGHGSEDGEIMLLDHYKRAKPVSKAALNALFTTLKDNTRVVVLNACYSQIQAEEITNSIDCAVGMRCKFYDGAAIVFAAAFYRAIGFGRTLQEAFDQGKVALQLEGLPGCEIPVLRTRKGIDASQLRIIPSAEDFARKACLDRMQQIQEVLLSGDYDSAYREIDALVRACSDKIQPDDQAKLKYLEALVHLEGKRPYIQAPSLMQMIERLMRAAYRLHHLSSYLNILAIFKYDFARNGFPAYKSDADDLMNNAWQLVLQDEDHTNIAFLSYTQPQLFSDYRHYFRI